MSLVNAETGEVVRRTLDECEAVIRRGLVEAAGALCEIRDSRLYLETHPNFDDYCRDRLGYSRRRADQIIDTGAVAASLGTIVPSDLNEGQVRALGPIKDDPEKMRAALAEATAQAEADGAKLTASRIKDAVDKITNPHREGVGGDGESNAGDASDGDGVDSHDVEQLEPEPTPVDPAPSPGADGEVEAATDGDEVGAPVGHGPAATSSSPKPPRLVTVHDFLKPVTSHSWLTGVDPAVFWDVNDLASADTFLSWVDSMSAYAATLRDNQPNHLRLVEGPA